MSFVVYNIKTTIILRNRSGGYVCATESAAKALLTRRLKCSLYKREDFAIAEYNYFTTNIEKTHTVINVMTGQPVEEPVNTPNCCSVGTETYWSM